MSSVPASRIRGTNDAPVATDGKFVLYWMTSSRRTRFNFGLQHAIDLARKAERPLVVLEALRCDYRWASDRLHHFVLGGMADNAARFERAGITYYPYVEPRRGAGRGLLVELARHAVLVVTDDFPAFFLPRMLAAASRQSPVRMEAVDANGLLPMRVTDRPFPTAYAFRRFLQRSLPEHLDAFPKAEPLSRLRLPALSRLPSPIAKRWPRATAGLLGGSSRALGQLPLDHSVGVTALAGGEKAARAALKRFVGRGLERYDEERNHPDLAATSGLSPYLHFGHLSSHEVCLKILDAEDWTSDRLATKATGSRAGWWGLSAAAEGFLDQIVTWRELGYNMCWHRTDHDRYETLPPWALETLRRHAGDEREHVYSLEQFEVASTHDPVWNAAQRQLRLEGVMHNYLRMLWGKKILEWSPTPQDALEIMVELNNRYALDGRNPNSYSGIFWVLGRYDRPWGPEREIFGKVRYMSSENTVRKLKLKRYLQRYGADRLPFGAA